MADLLPSPFFVGGPIPTALADIHLHGFEEERRELVQLMNRKANLRVGVLGPPGVGKSSLVLAVAPQLPAPRVHVDCARLWPATDQGFYRILLEALGLPPQEIQGSPAEVYARFPQPRKTARGLVVLEDAHRLAEIDDNLLAELPILGARIPHHLVLTGDAEALAPKCDAVITLRPFSEGTTADFLRRRFAKAGLHLKEDAASVFHEFTRGNPDSLQRLGEDVWIQARLNAQTEVGAGEVDATVVEIVDHLPTEAVSAWAATRGMMRDIFVAMCLHDLAGPTEIARRLGLEPKNVIVLLGRLASQHGLIERVGRGEYRVRDPLLKHYVRKGWGSPILR